MLLTLTTLANSHINSNYNLNKKKQPNLSIIFFLNMLILLKMLQVVRFDLKYYTKYANTLSLATSHNKKSFVYNIYFGNFSWNRNHKSHRSNFKLSLRTQTSKICRKRCQISIFFWKICRFWVERLQKVLNTNFV